MNQVQQVKSDCGRYRYLVSVKIASEGKPLGFMLNQPSDDEDPAQDTAVRRCAYLAKREGYGGALIAYIYALRPKYMEQAESKAELIGSETDRCITKMATVCDTVVQAHGDLKDSLRGGAIHRAQEEGRKNVRMLCLPFTDRKRPGSIMDATPDTELWPFPPVFLHHPESDSTFVVSQKDYYSGNYLEGTGACDQIHYERYRDLVEA